MIIFAMQWLAIGSLLWAFAVATGSFRLEVAPSRTVAVTGSVVMIVGWPWFAWVWVIGVWRMRG